MEYLVIGSLVQVEIHFVRFLQNSDLYLYIWANLDEWSISAVSGCHVARDRHISNLSIYYCILRGAHTERQAAAANTSQW